MNARQQQFLLGLGLVVATLSADAQVTATWTNAGGDQQWENSANWDPQTVPNNNTFDVHIGNETPAGLSSNFTIRSLTLSQAAATLQLFDNSSLQLPHNQSITNHGVIQLFGSQATSTTRLRFAGLSTIGGSGAIALDGVAPDSAILLQSVNRALQHAAEHTIRGRGAIDTRLGSFINNGAILADVPNSTLRVALSTNAANAHTGVAEARNGGTLLLAQGTWDLSGGGIISAAGSGSAVKLGSPAGVRIDLRSGTLVTSDGGAIVPINGDLQSCTNQGVIEIGSHAAGGHMKVSGTGLRNDGTIVISDGGGSFGGSLYFHLPATAEGLLLDGTGVIHLDGHDYNRVTIQALGKVTQAASHRIRGRGTVTGGTLRNNSSVTSDVPGGLILLQSYIRNNGILEAKNGGAITIDTHMDSESRGVMAASGTGSTILIGPRNFNHITAQRFVTADGGKIQAKYANFIGCVVEGTLQGIANASLEVDGPGLTNQGRIVLGSDGGARLEFRRAQSLAGNGVIELRNESSLSMGAANTIQFANPPQHTISGTGAVEMRSLSTFINEGTLAPDGRILLRGYGKLNFAGSSRAVFSLGGRTPITQYSVLSIANLEQPQVALEGTIAVSLRDNFKPAPADTFEVVNSTIRPLVGSFRNAADGQRVNTMDGAGSFRVTYSSQKVLLSDFGPPVAVPRAVVRNVQRNAAGEFVIEGTAPAGATVGIRASANPAGAFEQVGSVVVGAQGEFSWTDTAAAAFSSRFYTVEVAL